MAIKYDKDFTLYDHSIHAIEYLSYNFHRAEYKDVGNVTTARFVGEDKEYEVKIEVTRTRKPSR